MLTVNLHKGLTDKADMPTYPHQITPLHMAGNEGVGAVGGEGSGRPALLQVIRQSGEAVRYTRGWDDTYSQQSELYVKSHQSPQIRLGAASEK